MLSKYTALLLVPAVLVWTAASPARRVWLTTRQIWLGGCIAAACFAPVLIWNAKHGWASFAKQGGRTGDWRPARAAQFLGELLAGQIGLATPLIWLLCAIGLAAAVRHIRDSSWALLACVGGIPAWCSPSTRLATGCRRTGWRSSTRLRHCGSGPGRYLGETAPACRRARRRDHSTGLGPGLCRPAATPAPLRSDADALGRWPELAAAVAARARDKDASFVADDGYGDAALLARLLPAGLPVLGVEPRWAYFALPSGAALAAGRTGLLLRSARRTDAPDPSPWLAIEPAGEVARSRDGVIAETYRLYRVVGAVKSNSAIALLPRLR